MGERRGETEKREIEIEKERRGCETDVPKLYTHNEYEHSVRGRYRGIQNHCNSSIIFASPIYFSQRVYRLLFNSYRPKLSTIIIL